MNLRERGITVGDLIIIVIVIIVTTTLVKTFKKDKQTTLYLTKQEIISYEKTWLIKDTIITLFLIIFKHKYIIKIWINF